jgi:hypothetical protein
LIYYREYTYCKVAFGGKPRECYSKHNKEQKYATADIFLEFFTSFQTEMTGIFITRNYYRLFINTSIQKPVLRMPRNLCLSWIQTYGALVLR